MVARDWLTERVVLADGATRGPWERTASEDDLDWIAENDGEADG
jgi:hypothetical protein